MADPKEKFKGTQLEDVIREGTSYDTLVDHFNIIGEKIASSSRVEQILKQIAKSACQVLRANPVLLFQYDKKKNQLVPPPIYGGTLFEEAGYAKTFVFSGDTFAEMVIANRESLYFERQEDIDKHPFMNGGQEENVEGRPKTRFHKREHIKSLAALVLEAEDETLGLMFVNYRSHQSFSAPVKKLMKTFASYAAIAIKNSRLIEQLRRNEAFQRHIVEKIPDPVLVTRNKKVNDKLVWRIDVANRAAHELFGYEFQSREFEGKDARRWLGDELERLTSALQEGNGEVSDFEISVPHKDGHPIPVLISTSVLETDDADHISRTICIAKDLSTRKILEKQLHHLNRATLSLLNLDNLEEAYDVIFENLRHIGYDRGMISLIDEAKGCIVAKKATGHNWNEMLAKTNVPLNSGNILARVVRSGRAEFVEDCTRHPNCNQELARKVGIKSQYIIPLIAKNKAIGTLQIGLSDKQVLLKKDKYFLNESLKILLGFANQVAVAIGAHQQKIRIEKLQTTLADIGHEFRSPLHNVSTQLGGLKYHLEKKYGGDEKVRQITKIVQEEAFRAERQMKNALFSAGESFERMGQNFEDGCIVETVQKCADRLRETAGKRGINIIIYDSIKKLPAILYDKTQIEQVMTNILDNAVKYSYDNQNIEIRGDDYGRKIEISIKDIGVGIPERLHEKIFEGFSRSEKLDSTRFIPGTGLGLKIAKECVENHKGKIFVVSKPHFQAPKKIMNYEGYATTFIVMLPKNPKEY